MKHALPTRLALAAIALAFSFTPPATSADDVDEYLKAHADKGVTVTGLSDAQRGEVTILKHRDNELVVSGQYGELIVPITEETWRGLRPVIENAGKIDRMLRGGDYKEAMPLLRPALYPYLKFSTLPDEFTQVHELIATLFLNLSRNGLHGEMVRLLDQYPQVARQQELMPMLTEALDQVRAEGQFALPAGIYGKLAELDGPMKERATAMQAYCQAMAGDVATAKATLGKLPELKPGSAAFSEKLLAQGVVSLKQGEPGQALDAMSRGLVHANPTVGWLPEATFHIASAYREIGNFEAALGACEEIFKLDLNPLWSKKSREVHAELKDLIAKRQREQTAKQTNNNKE